MMALLVTLLVATQGAEAAVTILSPQEGQVVHGLVTIEANKSDPGDGWLSMRITPTSRQYLIAGLAPLSFTWNTQERDDSGRQRYRDGEYTVEVVAYDAAGRQQERAEAKVTVKNSLDLTEVGEQVLLHQDLHSGNVLRARREPWLVIDPKPLVGEREFGVVAAVRGSSLGRGDAALRYRLDRLTAELGLDRERVLGWALGQTLAWGFENGAVLPGQVEIARWVLAAGRG